MNLVLIILISLWNIGKKNKTIEKSEKKSYNKEKGLVANKSHVAVLRTVALFNQNDRLRAKLNGHFLLLVFMTRIINVAKAIIRLNAW